jgi:glycosyltransferase involved in cell wall biosynthesis
MPPRRVIFTIVSANYIAYAATLMQTVRAVHPEVARFIILADAPQRFEDIDLAAEVVDCASLSIALLDNMKLWYTVIEFNTALKPYAFQHFLDRLGYDQAVYLDPDILLFQPLATVFAALATHSLVLTPHMMRPLQDGREPSDLSIMKSGVYNLGFCAARRDEQTAPFMAWWADRCLAHCRVDVPANIFTDQRWMDLAPVFVERTLILRDTAHNVAYWNLDQRKIRGSPEAGWTVDGRPLVFFHFSGIAPNDPNSFSKHQNRFTIETLGDVAVLCTLYRQRVLANGFERFAKRRYGFARFDNGRPIEAFMRSWMKRAIDDERIDPLLPLELGSEYFDEPDETAKARGITLTRFMYQFWLDRPDLQRVFDIYNDDGLESFLEWFISGDAEAQGIDGRSIAAGAVLHDGAAHAEAANAGTAVPPWPSVAARCAGSTAADAGSYMHGDVVVRMGPADTLLPIQAALAWELRGDLQRVFPLQDLDGLQDYVAWAMTAALVENVVDRALLTPAFIAQIVRLSTISAYYKDVPLTEGMLITRRIAHRRDHLMGWLRFPTDRNSRLAHGFWFAFSAHDEYGWPDVIAARVRSYFHELTDFNIAGFALNRAEMAIWEMRSDLQRTFPLEDRRSAWNYLLWLLTQGLAELGLTIPAIDPRLPAMLQSDSKAYPDLPRALVMVHAARRDLQGVFDIETPGGRAGLLGWGRAQFQTTYAGTPLTALDLPFTQAEALDEPPPPPPALPVHRATLALTGQWTARSGRGEDLRCSVLSLREAGFSDFLIIDRDDGALYDAAGEAVPPGFVEATINLVHLNADTAYQDWRFLIQQGVRARRVIGWWAWELDRLPRRWLHAYSFYDEIWASTAFARAAFAREGLRPVKQVPMAVVAPQVQSRPQRGRLGLPDDATVFLFMFDFRSYASRKNPEAAVQAFLTAFPDPEENVRLVIKTQGGAAAAIPWRRLNALCRDPRIDIRDISMSRNDVLELIETADAFVSLHRSEGFGRGPAEAMLMGKPVIVTGYSGTADFATPDCAYVIGYRLIPVGLGEYPGAEGQTWADANVAQAAQAMRRIHEDPESARATGERGRARVEHLYNPDASGRAMLAALGLNPEPARRRPARRIKPDASGQSARPVLTPPI